MQHRFTRGGDTVATNDITRIRLAAGDAKKEQEEYDKYADKMRQAGQAGSIKPLKELRG